MPRAIERSAREQVPVVDESCQGVGNDFVAARRQMHGLLVEQIRTGECRPKRRQHVQLRESKRVKGVREALGGGIANQLLRRTPRRCRPGRP